MVGYIGPGRVDSSRLDPHSLTQGRVDSGADLTSGLVDPLPLGMAMSLHLHNLGSIFYDNTSFVLLLSFE